MLLTIMFYHLYLHRLLSCKNEKIRYWRERNNFPVKDDCLKAELVDILTKAGPQPTYILDEIVNEQGHEVL